MSIYGEHSRFFRVIGPETIETGTLEFPSEFVKDHGKHLSVYAHLKVPTGSVSKIELRRCQGRVLLDKGWRDFMDKYSISRWQILLFAYKGISRFHVQIFDVSDSEIKYPISSTRTSYMNPGEPEVGSAEEEEDIQDDEILDAGPSEVKTFESLYHASSMTEGTRCGAASARSRAPKKGEAFESLNPYFCVIVRHYMTKKPYVTLPVGATRAFFHNMENNNITLEDENGVVWDVKYCREGPPQYRVMFCAGWPKFFKQNRLKEGDTCIFELLCSKTLAFKVTFKGKNEASPRGMRVPPMEATQKRVSPEEIRKEVCNAAFTAMNTIMERPGSFMIYVSKTCVSPKPKVYIPSTANFRRYLKDMKHEENTVVFHGSSGKTWPVKYYFSASKKAAFRGKGWREFASDNHLQVRDVCVFEMIKGKVKAFKVTIRQGEPVGHEV